MFGLKHKEKTRYKPVVEPEMGCLIFNITVGTSLKRLVKGDYRGYVSTLRADPDNAGTIYIGKTEDKENINYPLKADDSQVTKADLDKLFVYASEANQILHVWAEIDIQRVTVSKRT